LRITSNLYEQEANKIPNKKMIKILTTNLIYFKDLIDVL